MAFVLAFLALPLAGAASGPDSASWDYSGPSAVQGRFEGSCEAWGVQLDPAVRGFSLESAGGRLLVRRTLVNETTISPDSNPIRFSSPERLEEESFPVGPGLIALAWPSDGLALVLPTNELKGYRRPFHASLDSDAGWNATGLHRGPRTPAEFYWIRVEGGEVGVYVSDFMGPSRFVTSAQPSPAHGDVTLYLRGVDVAAPGHHEDLPPWKTVTFDASTPLLARRTLVYTDAFLELSEARFVAPAGSLLVCGAIEGRVVGGYVADRAHGEGRVAGQRVEFSNRVVSLEGAFTLSERPVRPDAVGSTAEGSIRVLGVDFAAAAVQGPPKGAAALGLVAILALALLLALKNLGHVVGFFYSRLGRDRVLDHAGRDTIYQAILQAPGRDLSGLTKVTSFHLTTVAYHVQVLRRVGLVATVRHGRSVRVVPRELGTPTGLSRVLPSVDERLAFVRGLVAGGPRPLSELVGLVRERFKVGRRAAYNMVARAVARGIVRREARGRGVLVACA